MSESVLDIRFGEDFDGLSSPYLKLPIFQHSRIPLLEKEQFAPMRGSGREQLPEMTREVLIPRATVRASSRRRGRSQAVNVVCQMKKMIVRVNKQILGLDGSQSELKLGTCDISKTTKHYHVFIYDMDQCASKRQLINNRVTYSNILRYSPVMDLGPIRRVMPFSLPVECHFNRYHYSYKIGYIPQVRLQNHFKPLRTVDSVVLTPRDELWRRLSPKEEYTIGHPMYFQADGPPLAEDERLFVDSCYVTISSSHLSMPRFTVIENHGCMIDSMSMSGKVITSEPWIMESDLNIFEEEQTTSFLPEEVGTGFVQVITPRITTPAENGPQETEIGRRHFVPDSAVVVEDKDKIVEPRRTSEEVFEEVFGMV
ncbi:Zona pellucida sperm-binding protein 3 [Anabarilius grahami]|uniref:Zona pellucida sperm-binding protein 3 n=1 Tax=Anabarilius grahami TaxID=495550 RepID=A0A3N0Y573_ANAGA|nr:Zona pellucida sperm-binding protein 3 [Anabarilius grahami]